MQKCKHFCAALASLLVLETTNRKPVVLIAVVQVRVVEVDVQEHVVRVVAIVLRRTPEVRVEALVVATPIAAPVAGRQRREPESIRAVAVIKPATGGFKGRTGTILAAHRREQGLEFRFAGQMPTAGANCFCCRPGVQATVLGAVGGHVVVATLSA